MELEKLETMPEKTKTTRRKFETAFSSNEDENEELEGHIVPEATFGEDGLPLPVTSDKEKKNENPGSGQLTCQVPFCVMTFSSTKEYQDHYNRRHMNSCSVCKMSLPSAHILEMHVLEIHDTLFSLMAEKKPMYQCFVEICEEKFQTPEIRKEHCLKEHKFPNKFLFWDCKPPKQVGSSRGKHNHPKNQNQISKPKGKKTTSAEECVLGMDIEGTNQPQLNGADVSVVKEEGSGTSKSRSNVPKHIAFGHAQHRSFNRNAYASATNPSKTKSSQHSDSVIDMKDVEDALIS